MFNTELRLGIDGNRKQNRSFVKGNIIDRESANDIPSESQASLKCLNISNLQS
jgi:hypothetical protein